MDCKSSGIRGGEENDDGSRAAATEVVGERSNSASRSDSMATSWIGIQFVL